MAPVAAAAHRHEITDRKGLVRFLQDWQRFDSYD
jgi:hypothetical protein